MCTKVNSKKYQTRKSPPFHARDCKGSVKKGKDGTYVSKADARGVYKWMKVTKGIKSTKNTRKKNTKKINRKNMFEDTVWGKNKKLEKWWESLASGKKAVVIYKDGTHKHVQLPNRTTQKYDIMFNEFDADPNVESVLSSNLSQDAYELYLYPRAKDASVEDVIKHYKKYFKTIFSLPKDLVAKGLPLMKKVRLP